MTFPTQLPLSKLSHIPERNLPATELRQSQPLQHKLTPAPDHVGTLPSAQGCMHAGPKGQSHTAKARASFLEKPGEEEHAISKLINRAVTEIS